MNHDWNQRAMNDAILNGNQLISDWQHRAQVYANRSLQSYSDYYQKPREMTAEDLGLPTTLPYAFWLGAG